MKKLLLVMFMVSSLSFICSDALPQIASAVDSTVSVVTEIVPVAHVSLPAIDRSFKPISEMEFLAQALTMIKDVEWKKLSVFGIIFVIIQLLMKGLKSGLGKIAGKKQMAFVGLLSFIGIILYYFATVGASALALPDILSDASFFATLQFTLHQFFVKQKWSE